MLITQPEYYVKEDCGYCNGKKGIEGYAVKELENLLENSEHEDKEAFIELARLEDVHSSTTIGYGIQHVSCATYDKFMNMGFRRSGTFLYKIDLLRGCCRLLTIRTNLSHLKISKQQRQTVNRFIRTIKDGNNEIIASGKVKNTQFDLSNLISVESEVDKSTFYTRFEPSQFSEEKYALYKKYQVKVHNDKPEDVSISGFKSFLCDTPFFENEVNGTKETWVTLNLWKTYHSWPKDVPRRIGPTHECYYLKNKLIAISVIDFLPSGVSSVYFIWDPDYPELSLGTLSGLREIYMCNKLNLGYYYLGYYVDDCPKMKYKRKFGGEILDVSNMTYFPFEKVDEYLKDGRLFTCSSTPEGTPIEAEAELKLNPQGFPFDFEDSLFNNGSFRNVANEVYGQNIEKLSRIAFEANKAFGEEFGFQYDSKIPLVVPGLLPIPQLVELFKSKNILNQEFRLIDRRIGQLEMSVFKNLDDYDKSVVLLLLRLIGYDLLQEAFILV